MSIDWIVTGALLLAVGGILTGLVTVPETGLTWMLGIALMIGGLSLTWKSSKEFARLKKDHDNLYKRINFTNY